ncbi:uncharacterized protein LOC120633448 [Pararge aegeria]|uniref:uncharacterized protein LOC120633448 n=1 Tax=Pararge aegeria TaxID=116150 RepID=UPI0019D28A77|nr:uncharacterized protein LOC120633448 [Pararge aegeria]
MSVDPLIFMPVDRWSELKLAFKSDWPRSISGYLVLETQEFILKSGIDYGFKVYCPYGNVNNGIVALNIKNGYYEVIIQCPIDDTGELEDALRKTNIIDWRRCRVPYAPQHILDCIKRLYLEKELKIYDISTTRTFILGNEVPLYDVRTVGRSLVCVATCDDTLAASHIQTTSSIVVAAAISAEQAKRRKYKTCIEV